MGAHIELRPDRRFIIEGVDELTEAATTLEGDRMEAFSYLAAGLIPAATCGWHGCASHDS